MSKRARGCEEVTLEDGISAAKAILKLSTANLIREDRVSNLPYPGIGVPPGRPPVTLAYIGSDFVFDLAELFWSPKKPRLLIEGPRGFGKSSDLRALVCFLHSHFALNKEKVVLVSIWNLNAAVADEVQVVKDALLFAYLVRWEGQLILGSLEPAEGYDDAVDTLPQEDSDDEEDESDELDQEKMEVQQTDRTEVLEHEDKTGHENEESAAKLSEEIQQAVENDRKVVMEKIQTIASMQEAIDFVEQRKREQGEVFRFFADGWEAFDADKTDRPRIRHKVQNLLEGFFMHGSTVILALSADSTILDVTRSDTHVISKVHPFNEVQYDSYKKLSVLGQLDQVRTKDMGFYTGRVPWLLEILLECCDAFRRQTVADKRRACKGVQKGGRVDQAAVFLKLLPRTYPKGDMLAEMLCGEDDAWAAVLSMYREKLDFVRKEIDKIELQPGEQGRSMAAMGAKDKTFFIAAEGRYCSDFIARMYIEGFRAKEETARQSARGVWIPYCRFLLSQPRVNWSSMGWLAEDLVGDVITHRTVYLGSSLGFVKDLRLDEFTSIPSIAMKELPKRLKPGHGFFYKPLSHKLPYIDGLIIYMDLNGCIQIIPLQVTVSVDRHLVSAPLFLRMENLRKWFPDLEELAIGAAQSTGSGAAQSTGNPPVELAFVFIGSSKRLSDEHEQPQPAVFKHLRSGTRCISPAYRMIYMPFSKSLGGDGGLNVEELAALEELEAKRSDDSLQLADLPKLTKAELVNLAAGLGIQLDMKVTKETMLMQVKAVL